MLKKTIILAFAAFLATIYGCDVDSGNNDPVVDIETIESKGLEALKKRDWDGALTQYSKSVESGKASSEGKLWWAALSASSLVIDSNIQEIVGNMGITGYPTQLDEVLFSGNSRTIISNDIKSPFNNLAISNSSDFSHLTDDKSTNDFCALLYNIQKNYPDGLNGLFDSVIASTDKVNEISKQLLSIPDDASITLEYSMFYPDNYTPMENGWLSEVDPLTNEIQPAKLTVGKAEIYVLASTLELYRSIFLLLQTISLNTDFDGYWGLFNPKDGTAYDFGSDNRPSNLKAGFNWSTIKSPLQDDFLSSRSDASSILAESKKHLANFISYLDASGKLLTSRDADSKFFFSPNNKNIGTSEWDKIITGQEFVSTLSSLLLKSLHENEVIFYPEDLNVKDINSLSYYKDINNWPSTGKGMVLGKFFEKPLFTLENAFDMTENGDDFKFYVYDGMDIVPAVKTDVARDAELYIKLNDITFNGFLLGAENDIMNTIIGDKVGNSFYILINKNENYLVGHSLYPVGESFTIGSTTHTSTGSFFVGKIKDHTESI